MPVSPMKDLGPCSIIWDPDDANIEINPTFGGVAFRDEILKKEINEDQQGKTPVNHVHIGRTVKLTVPLTRFTLAKLEAVIASSTKGTNNLTVVNSAGRPIILNAKRIVIKPMIDNVSSSDVNTWLHIHKAYPFVTTNWAYDNKNQRITDVIFRGYSADGCCHDKEIWRIGPGVEIEDFEDFYRDDFDDDSIGDEWSSHKTDANRTIVEAGGILTIHIDGSIEGRWATTRNEAPKLYQNVLIPPFEIIAKISAFALETDTACGIFIGHYDAVWYDAPQRAYKFWKKNPTGIGHHIEVDRVDPGAQEAGSDEYWLMDESGELWFKIEVDASEDVRFYVSDDGESWFQMEQGGNPHVWSGFFLSDMQIGILAHADSGPEAITAKFEYFEINMDIYKKYIESSIGNITAVCEDGSEYTEKDSIAEVNGSNSTFYFDSSTRYLYIYTSDGSNPSNFTIEIQAD